MELEDEGPDADDVVLQLLQGLVKRGKLKRAESVLAPKEEAAPVPAEGDEAEMAELEAMLASEGGETKPEACPTCGGAAGECAC